MARPKLNIDPEEVYKLARIGCKTSEIADWFGCSRDTIENRFSAELTKGWESLKHSLRRKQIDVAMRGNAVMLIWLGKQMLGQVDSIVNHIELEEKKAKSLSDEELSKAALTILNKAKEEASK